MTDPISATDPAMVVGLMAALAAIGLALRTKRAGMAQLETEHDRATWMTNAAGSILEHAADLHENGESRADTDQPVTVDLTENVDLTDRVDLTDSIDLTDAETTTTDEPTN